MLIRVASREQAIAYHADADYIISISGSNQPSPKFDNPHVLPLHFDDIRSDMTGFVAPNQRHVEAIIEFAKVIKKDPGTLLVHCQAGVSRSSAAALIVQSYMSDPGQEKRLFAELHKRYPYIRPNVRMLRIADELLKRDGRLATCAAHRPQKGMW